MRWRNKHTGCTGDDACPHCPKLDLPGYEAVRANLTGQPIRQAPRSSPCIHLGEATGETATDCPTCPGKAKRFKVHACAVHGRCIQGQSQDGLAGCWTCPDYTTLAPLARPIVRNLLYHIYPFRGGVWRWNVLQLRARLALFTGRRTVAICHGPETDPPSSVRWELGDSVDYVEVKNRPDRREVETFRPLWESVRNAPGVTLYAHAKGVTRPPGSTAAEWTALLYRAYMDYWPVVEGLLETHPLAGCLKRHVKGWTESASTWHYSGSWYWVRNDALFARPDWYRIDPFWSGIEPWPSLHFKADEAGCVFKEWAGHGQGMYDPAFCAQTMAEWERWQAAHAGQERQP